MAAIDIDMSEFTQKTTLASTDFITGTLADGSAVKIKVSDIASVVAGIIGNPLGVYDERIENIDKGETLKSITTPGIYTNIHGVGVGIEDDGTLIVIKCFGGYVRIFLGSSDKNIFYNTEKMGIWYCISTSR